MPPPPADLPALASILAEHGLGDAVSTKLVHTGFSGATLDRLTRSDGATYVLKRMSIDRDWIMRATNDVHCREVRFAEAHSLLGARVRTPALAASRDGDGFAILMLDITNDLLPHGIVDLDVTERVIKGIVALHESPAPRVAIPWCSVRDRLMLLTPATAAIARSYGAPVADDITQGWRLFRRHAPDRVSALLLDLFHEPDALLRALDQLPVRFLHGDLKFDNIGVSTEGDVLMLDWAMTLRAPAAVELGWFLAINSRRMTMTFEDVMSAYARAVSLPAAVRPRHNALMALCGLLLRGWRKALDAEAGEPRELRWWCERATAAERFL